MERIHLYHTNDLHSHFENWPRIRSYIHNRKEYHAASGEDMLLFDIGDHADRSHPLTEGSHGQANVALMNELHYDAVTIGNNEGITFSYDHLDHLYDKANFPVVVANLFNKEGVRPDWAFPTHILTTSHGTKVGVVGVTAEYDAFYGRLGWHVSNAKDELKAQVRVLKEKVDIVVFLSHLGIREDQWVAEECPEIDVILGGHTHHVLEQGEVVGSTLLAAAGKYGLYVGHVELEFDPEVRSVVSKTASLTETATMQKPDDEDVQIQGWLDEGKALLNEPVCELDRAYAHNPVGESELTKMLSDTILSWCDADCSMVTGGLILGSLEKGTVTQHDFHRILPHPINPCLIELTGAQLKEVFRQSRNPEWPKMQVKGLGFRGTILGSFVYSGVEMDERAMRVTIQGQPLDPQKTYTLATVDMFTFGYFFPELQRAKKHYFMPEFLRDLMKERMKQDSMQNSSTID